MSESITITVAGVDRTEYLVQPGLEWGEALRERKTINCEFLRRSGSWKPQRGQHVTLSHSVEGSIFGGYITSVRRRKEGGSNAGGVFFACTVVDYKQICARRRAAAFTYIDTALEDIFTQLMTDSLVDEGFTISIDDPGGPVIAKFEIQSPRPKVDEAADRLCEQASTDGDIWYWDIDASKVIHLFKQDTTPAPFSITDATPYILGGDGEYGEVEDTNQDKVNRFFAFLGQYLRPAATESFVGDGSTQQFELDYPCGAKPTIAVNGVDVGDFIGVDGQTGYQWYWSQNSKTIRQDDAGTLLTGSDTLDVTYQGLDRLEIGPVEDAADASAEGVLQGDGTGIYEGMLTIETPQTQGDAETIIAAELARRKQATITFRGATYTSGLRAGQELPVNLTDLDINLSMLIQSVTMTDQGGGHFLWRFTAIYGTAREDWKRRFLGLEPSTGISGGGSSAAPGTDVLQISFAGSQGQQGVAFAASLIATGGVQPYAYSIASGSLPTGLSLDADTGRISGTPSVAGAFAFTGRVTDGATTTADVSVTINIAQPSGASVLLAPSSVSGADAGHGTDYNVGPARLVHFQIDVTADFASVPMQIGLVWLSRDDGAYWAPIGHRLFDADPSVVTITSYRPATAEDWKVAVQPGGPPYDPGVLVADADLPSDAVKSLSFTIAALDVPASGQVASLSTTAGAGGDFPYLRRTIDGEPYFHIEDISFTEPADNVDTWGWRLTATDLDASDNPISDEQPAMNWDAGEPGQTQSWGPLQGKYGDEGYRYTRSGDIAKVRLKLYGYNRVDQTEQSFANSAAATLQCTLDVTVAVGGAIPEGAIPGDRLDPSTLDPSLVLDPSTGKPKVNTRNFGNKLLNGNFENGSTGWGLWATAAVVTHGAAISGTRMGALLATSDQLFQDFISAGAGDVLVLSCDSMCETGTTGQQLWLVVQFMDKDNNEVGVSSTTVTPAVGAPARYHLTTSAAPAGTTTCRPAFIALSGLSGVIYVDNAVLQDQVSTGQGTEPNGEGGVQVPTGGISETLLAALAVSTAKVQNAAIALAKLADLSVSTAKMVDAAVEEVKIATSAVSATKIAALAVQNAKIDNAAVTTAKISNLAITTALIDGAAVTTAKIGSAQITTALIANLAVTTALIDNAAITTAKIADAAITTAKIGDAQITNAKIQDATIQAAKIASLAVSQLTGWDGATVAVTSGITFTFGSSTTTITGGSVTTGTVACAFVQATNRLETSTAGFVGLSFIGGVKLGSYYLWVDASGKLRISSGAPATDSSGTVVGTQT